MLIFNINGGLGNQMFQYAFCLYLSLKYKKQMFFDLEALYTDSLRNLEIDNFQIEIPVASPSQMRRFKKSRYARVNYYLNQLFLNGKNYFYEPKVTNTIIAEGESYYWGYWQKPQAVLEIDKELRESFILKNALSTEAQTFKEKILNISGESVSIHIRKADYLLQKNSYFSSCEPQYYYDAIDNICQSRTNKLHFFIFSDDFAWVQDNIHFPEIDYTFVNSKVQRRPSEDLYLMSICNHNIIANSTFSWWAAYLNNYQHKIVISPKYWFKDHKRQNINLKTWIELKNE